MFYAVRFVKLRIEAVLCSIALSISLSSSSINKIKVFSRGSYNLYHLSQINQMTNGDRSVADDGNDHSDSISSAILKL
jgi:hypothetical protein